MINVNLCFSLLLQNKALVILPIKISVLITCESKNALFILKIFQILIYVWVYLVQGLVDN